jgi:1-acyl-sn-glycerol-3-phosphate acyltransferase
MAAPGHTTTTPRRPRKTWADEQSVFWFRFTVIVIGLILRFWVRRYRVIGTENVPPSGGVFVVANHTSGMDPLLIGYAIADRMPWGPGKVEIFKSRFFGYVMRKLGIFPLRQDIADAGAVRTMITLYRRGKPVIVYPEGSRSPTAEVKTFNPDFARLALKMRATLLPVAIAGAADLLPIGKLILRPNTPVVVVVGKPFELTEYYSRRLTTEVAREAAAELRSRVGELLEVARQERQALAGH